MITKAWRDKVRGSLHEDYESAVSHIVESHKHIVNHNILNLQVACDFISWITAGCDVAAG